MFAWMLDSVRITVFGLRIPIALYSGKKATYSRAIQWCFYLFYPVHLTVLVFVRMLVDHQPVVKTLMGMLGF